MAALVASAPDAYEVYCDLRDVPLIGESLGGNLWMELRTFSFRRDAYDLYFKDQYSKSFVLEKHFFKIIQDQLNHGNLRIFPRFLIQPVFDGFSGHSNASYRSHSYRAKEAIRAISRKIIPNLWL
jgi:hypothetical protein